MYQAVIFDLDGTLVQTEKLKAISYARAAMKLCPRSVSEGEVLEAFKEVVGRSRQEVAEFLIERFDLEDAARERKDQYGVQTSWQAYVQVRLDIYDEMLSDPDALRSHKWHHNIALLNEVRHEDKKIGLATMSHCRQARKVLEILELDGHFDFMATRDDVENGKPDPEIYLLVAAELDVPRGECLVIEDSPSGVQAAQAAGMGVIAVTTPFTRQAFQERDVLDPRWVVRDPETLSDVVRECIHAHQKESHGG